MNRSSVHRLLYVEVAVCFGPLVVVWLIGVLLFPVWAIMIVGYFNGWIPFAEPEGILPWRVLWPMVMVVSGGVGMFGLIRLVSLASLETPRPERERTTLLAISGVGSRKC